MSNDQQRNVRWTLSRRSFLGGTAAGVAALWLPAWEGRAVVSQATPSGTLANQVTAAGMAGAADGAGAPNDFFLIDPTSISCYPGGEQAPILEQYLYRSVGSSTGIEVPPGGWGATDPVHEPPPYLSKRWADTTDWYSYRIPVDASTPAPLYLTMVTKGQPVLTVGGKVLYNSGPTGQGDYTAREFKLDDPSVWAEGYVEAKFQNAVPSGGWGPNLYSLELGPTSRWNYRLQHIHWDTTKVVWSVGYQDGYASEFAGTTTDFTVGGDFSQLSPSGTILLRWDQADIDPTKKYYFLAGCIGNGGTGNDTIDVGNTGTDDVNLPTAGERVYDVEVTDYVQPTGNVVKLSVAAPAQYDFFALVEVSPTPVIDPNSLRLSFAGNEQAEHFTRLATISLFWMLEMQNHANTGFIDASTTNGFFWNSYWVADTGPAMTELFKWGFLDRVREVIGFMPVDTSGESQGHYGQDVAAGNLVFSTMCNLMRADNLDKQTVAAYWPRLSAGMACLIRYCQDNPYGLVYGTNIETSADSLGIYVNATSYAALSNAADIAQALGHTATARTWQRYATSIHASMSANLRWASDTTWLDQPMQAGTWMYGINRDGSLPGSVFAAWASIGSQKDAYWGLWADDPDFRDISNATLDYHSETFWSYWGLSGSNVGFGTNYGAMSERGGWALNSLLEADRLGDAKKNMEHITFNSTDMNFIPLGPNTANDPANYSWSAEISPWAIIRDTDPTDLGNHNEQTEIVEDLNLVEYTLFLKNARIMAGVDDALYDGGNLVVIPRLPWGWTSVNVNGWPVTVRNGKGYQRTSLSYRLEVQPEKAEMTISTTDPVVGARLRLGPFAPSAVGTGVTVNGKNSAFSQEVRGDASWLWVTCDLDAHHLTINAEVSLPLLQGWYPFSGSGSSALTTGGGTWNVNDGHISVTSTGKAWALGGKKTSDGVVEADTWLESGAHVGVALRASADRQGYALLLDRQNAQAALLRLPSTVLASAPITVNLERTYRLRLEAVGTELTGYLNGVQILTATDSTWTSGRRGLLTDGASASFSNLLLTGTPLLDDDFTTLQGWNTAGGTWSADVGTALVNAKGAARCVSSVQTTDSIYTVNARLATEGAAGISARCGERGTGGYTLILNTKTGGVALLRGVSHRLAFKSLPIALNQIYNLRLETKGHELLGYVDGQLCVRAADSTYERGHLGLAADSVTARFGNAQAVAAFARTV